MRISVQNQKGGTGKTTIALHLAHGLAMRDRRVLLIDADPQGSSRDWAAAREDAPPFQVIGLDRPTIHRDIDGLETGYDDVVIDGPPRVSALAKSCIAAADLVLVPVQPSPYDIWAAEEVVSLIREASVFNDLLKSAFVVNRKIANTAIARDVFEALENYEIPALKASITQRVIFAESAATGATALELEPKGSAAKEVRALVAEVMGMMKNA